LCVVRRRVLGQRGIGELGPAHAASSDGQPVRNAELVADRHPYRHRHGDGNRNGNSDRDGNRNADAYADRDGNRDADVYADRDAHGNADRDAHGHGVADGLTCPNHLQRAVRFVSGPRSGPRRNVSRAIPSAVHGDGKRLLGELHGRQSKSK
jgi:hypothetical protein